MLFASISIFSNEVVVAVVVAVAILDLIAISVLEGVEIEEGSSFALRGVGIESPANNDGEEEKEEQPMPRPTLLLPLHCVQMRCPKSGTTVLLLHTMTMGFGLLLLEGTHFAFLQGRTSWRNVQVQGGLFGL